MLGGFSFLPNPVITLKNNKFMSHKKNFLTLIFILNALFATGQVLTPDHHVWYTYPAENWSTQALHIGNGYMGASFYGDVKEERFDIAEKTFWAGGPLSTPDYKYGIQPGGKDKINEIRELVKDGKYAEADKMSGRYIVGDHTGYGYFSTVGNLLFRFANQSDNVSGYQRGLDLADGYGFVRYKSGDVNYSRTYFCSYPDQVMAVKLSADKQGAISFDLEHKLTYEAEKMEFTKAKEWIIRGVMTGNGQRYVIRMQIETDGGTVDFKDNRVSVNGANEACVFYAIDTEYVQNYPDYLGENPDKTTKQTIKNIVKKGYKGVWETHLSDYHNLYNRVSFELVGDERYNSLPTDKRIANLQAGCTDDSQMKALWFNFSRYLVIAASRENTLPSNLQGAWNTFKSAPWNGNYQSNINLQEMYWSCGPTNLPECEMSYVNWIKDLVPSGRKTAEAYYGTEGWVSHTTGNIWGFTAPGSDILWGLYPSGSAWHCRHLWEHYAFTQDMDYLKNVYPVLKEAALFWLNNMVEYQGYLIVTPSVSAEHGIEVDKENNITPYSTLNGEQGGHIYTVPSFQDIEMVYNLFSDVCKAMEVLNADADMKKQIETTMSRMMPLRIGKYGQLQEWVIDADNPRNHHRHLAHLYAMFPGDMVSMRHTPELAEGVKKALRMRGYGKFGSQWPHTGGNWSMMWRIALWTRLCDGDVAIDAFNTMIRQSGYENMGSNQSGNYQVDATMATAGVFAEMLMQSHDGTIHLLPALPTEWPEGKVKGIVARGGYQVDMEWKNGKLTAATLYVPKGKKAPEILVAGKAADGKVKVAELPAL